MCFYNSEPVKKALFASDFLFFFKRAIKLSVHYMHLESHIVTVLVRSLNTFGRLVEHNVNNVAERFGKEPGRAEFKTIKM